jgi:alpha-L-rhamnosidase
MKTHLPSHTNLRLTLFCLTLIFIQTRCLYARSPNAPDNLRSCDKVNPVGTDDKPYLGWYVNDLDNDEIQTAYQILVASSQSNLDANKGDKWDSGRVSSGKQNYIVYDGSPLTSAARYYWKVRTWDKDGNVSPYSAAAVFDTGLFTSSDWTPAKWIKRDTTVADDYSPEQDHQASHCVCHYRS